MKSSTSELGLNDRQAAQNAGLPLGEYRKQILIVIEAAKRNMPSITVAKCVAWNRLMQTCLPKCLAREQIQRSELNQTIAL
jgi:hypothetical protein